MTVSTYNIRSRNNIEREIIETSEFKEAMNYSYPKKNRAEKSLGEHVEHLLEYVDFLGFEDNSDDLRLLSMLHDYGKYKTKYSENGNLVGKSHSEISTDFAKNFISDERILKLIRNHDKYFHFFRDENKNKFKQEKFLNLYSSIDLDTMAKFNYVDSCEREKESIMWFENKCKDLGLITEEVYKKNSKVLTYLVSYKGIKS